MRTASRFPLNADFCYNEFTDAGEENAMTRTELFERIKERLAALYGSRFMGLVLYGSAARGDAAEDSDIDLLCLLQEPVNPYQEVRPIVEATSQIRRDYAAHAVSIRAVSIQEYERGAYPLVIEAKREGIPV
jgi:predicted nucleotidyltransferase